MTNGLSTRCQQMMQRITLALDAFDTDNSEVLDEISSKLLPDVHDLLLLISMANTPEHLPGGEKAHLLRVCQQLLELLPGRLPRNMWPDAATTHREQIDDLWYASGPGTRKRDIESAFNAGMLAAAPAAPMSEASNPAPHPDTKDAPVHRYKIELPDGDQRTARVWWAERKVDGNELTHWLCVKVESAPAVPRQINAWEREISNLLEAGKSSIYTGDE